MLQGRPSRLAAVALLSWLAASNAGLATEVGAKHRGYDLRVEGDLVSLRVANGSLLEIVEDLGGRVGFEVVANIRSDVQVSADFDGLKLSEAIRKICAGVGYVEAPDPATGKIARLVLVSTNNRTANRVEARREPLRERPVIAEPPPEPEPEAVQADADAQPPEQADPAEPEVADDEEARRGRAEEARESRSRSSRRRDR